MKRNGEVGRRLMHLVPAPAVRLMKRRVQSRPGVRQLETIPGHELSYVCPGVRIAFTFLIFNLFLFARNSILTIYKFIKLTSLEK